MFLTISFAASRLAPPFTKPVNAFVGATISPPMLIRSVLTPTFAIALMINELATAVKVLLALLPTAVSLVHAFLPQFLLN